MVCQRALGIRSRVQMEPSLRRVGRGKSRPRNAGLCHLRFQVTSAQRGERHLLPSPVPRLPAPPGSPGQAGPEQFQLERVGLRAGTKTWIRSPPSFPSVARGVFPPIGATLHSGSRSLRPVRPRPPLDWAMGWKRTRLADSEKLWSPGRQSHWPARRTCDRSKTRRSCRTQDAFPEPAGPARGSPQPPDWSQPGEGADPRE